MASDRLPTSDDERELERVLAELRALGERTGVSIAELLDIAAVASGKAIQTGTVRSRRGPGELLSPATPATLRPASRSLLAESGMAVSPDPVVAGEGSALSEPQPNDRYKILDVLGEGGMGQVYRAFDRDLNRVVALKVIDRELIENRPETLARFIEEAQTTAQLEHPGIVPVHEMGRLIDGRFYFTMKVVHGRSLEQVARAVHEVSTDAEWGTTADGWTFRKLIDAFQRVCQSVAYAHSRGVLHRDLKPQNVMVDAQGDVLLMDWGIAKVLGRPLGGRKPSVPALAAVASKDSAGPVISTRAQDHANATMQGVITGTPNFMSPEQARGANDEIDERSDVYALGAILYDLLAGERPYAKIGAMDVLRQLQFGPPKSLRLRDKPIPEELVTIQERAMARSKDNRYPNAQALAKSVSDWLDGVAKQDRAERVFADALTADAEAAAKKEEAERLAREADRRLRDVPLWAPEDEKAPSWVLQDRAASIQHHADLKRIEAEQLFSVALTHAPEHAKIHAALARRHADEHRVAEAAGDREGMARAERYLRAHAHALPKSDSARQAHLDYLDGTGRLSIVTEPAAAVALYRIELRDRRLSPIFERELGRTPLHEIMLPIGSYVLELTAEGFEPLRYPVRIERQGHWDGVPPGATEPESVRLLPRGSVGRDAAYVPAGWFWFGGDPEVTNTVTKRRLWLDAFVIQRTPVTNAQYLRFLNELVRAGREDEALRAVPRERAADAHELGVMIYARGANGAFALPPDPSGARWTADKPVTCVTWFAAHAYTHWLAETTGQPWRLPTELEWEKAARGVDARFFAWGDFLDPSWLCMRQSHRGEAHPASVHDYPIDTSVYGVRGLAGNVRDWCLDIHQPEIAQANGERVPPPDLDALLADKESSRVVRGGSWSSFANNCRVAFRFLASPFFSGDDGGIRPARSI